MRQLLRPVARWAALRILLVVGWYFRRITVYQRVWVHGEQEDLGPGAVERTSVKRNEWSEPVGLTLFIRMRGDRQRLLRVDLTEMKLDSGSGQWHFFRPGTPDPDPRIPR